MKGESDKRDKLAISSLRVGAARLGFSKLLIVFNPAITLGGRSFWSRSSLIIPRASLMFDWLFTVVRGPAGRDVRRFLAAAAGDFSEPQPDVSPPHTVGEMVTFRPHRPPPMAGADEEEPKLLPAPLLDDMLDFGKVRYPKLSFADGDRSLV